MPTMGDGECTCVEPLPPYGGALLAYVARPSQPARAYDMGAIPAGCYTAIP